MEIKGVLKSVQDWFVPKAGIKNLDPEARSYTGTWENVYTQSYDGEKNLGEVGPLVDYVLDMEGLRMRSWKSYLDSEITQTTLNKFTTWTIGKGLKLQSEPVMDVLESEGISFNKEEFNKKVESRFALNAKSKTIHIFGEKTLRELSREAFVNAKVGGDVLVLLRVVKGMVKVQLVDGAHIVTPWLSYSETKGKLIVNGIQYAKNGDIEGYWIKKYNNGTHTEFQFIKSRTAGKKTAFLVYGLKYRIDTNRGIPLISAVMETIAKMERYKEATVGAAEEVAKIAYQIVHQNFSTGENPVSGAIAKAFDVDSNASGKGLPTDDAGKQLATQVAATTNKQAYNNPIGAEIKAMTSGNKELHFKDFYSANIDLVCATLGMPPEVAMSKYDSNYSASRAALKDWEHTLSVERTAFTEDFMQPIYELWLDVQVMTGKIKAPGYLKAVDSGDDILLAAYRNARFVGSRVPHIDPLKEVEAVRLKLGKSGANIPLVSVSDGVEELNGGDSSVILERFSEEYKTAEKLGIKVVADPVITITESRDFKEKKD